MDLQTFYNNKELKNNVYEYLVEFCKLQAIEKTFAKESTEHIAEAKEIIDKAFSNLEVLFAPKSQSKDLTNEAR